MKIPDTPEQIVKDLQEEKDVTERQIGYCRSMDDDVPGKAATVAYFEGKLTGLAYAIMKIEAHIERQEQ